MIKLNIGPANSATQLKLVVVMCLLAATATTLPLPPARAQGAPPAAILSDVRGRVEVLHRGAATPAKVGGKLMVGDRVHVISGHATLFSVTAPPRVVGAGQVVTVGKAGTTSRSTVWSAVMAGMAQSLAHRSDRVPATMRPGALQALEPVDSLVLPGKRSFNWLRPSTLGALSIGSYLVEVSDDTGTVATLTALGTTVGTDGLAAPLRAGHRYRWRAVPCDLGGRALHDDLLPTRPAWFEIATAAQAASLQTDLAAADTALRGASATTRALSRAAIYQGRGFNAAAVALLEPLLQQGGSAPDAGIAALLRQTLSKTHQFERLARCFPGALQLADVGGANSAAVQVDLPTPTEAMTAEAETGTAAVMTLPPAGLKSYNDPGGLFHIELPVRWGAVRYQLAPLIWATSFAAQTGSKPDISVVTAPTAGLQGSALATQLFGMLASAPGFALGAGAPASFSGEPVQKTSWTWQQGTVATKGYSIAFERGATSFVLSVGYREDAVTNDKADTDVNDYARARRAAESVLATFGTTNIGAAAIPRETYKDLSAEIEEGIRQMDVLNQRAADYGAAAPATDTVPAARSAFEAAEARRRGVAPATLQAADAARFAAAAATRVAWLLWDSGKHTEAASWFEKGAALSAQNTAAIDAYYEAVMTVADARIAVLRCATFSIALQFPASVALDGAIDLQVARNSVLQNAARDSGNYRRQLQCALRELALQKLAANTLLLGPDEARDLPAARIRIARAIEAVGDAQQNLAAFGAAAKSYQLALDWRRTLPETSVERRLDLPMRSLGYLYMATGDYVHARDWYRQALATLEADAPLRQADLQAEDDAHLHELKITSVAQETALLHNNIGILDETAGDLHAAEVSFGRALEAVEPMAKTSSSGYMREAMRASALGNLATLRADSGEIEEALTLADQVIAIDRSLGDDSGCAFWLLNRAAMRAQRGGPGDAAAARSDAMQARRLLQAAHQRARVVSADLFLGNHELAAGNGAAAEVLLREALGIARTLGDADLIANSARALANRLLKQCQASKVPTPGLWKSFDSLLQEAAAADSRMGAPDSRTSTLYLLAQGKQARHDLKGALADLQTAIALLEAVRATARSQDAYAEMGSVNAFYSAAVKLLLKMGRPDDAFDMLSRARSKKLIDSLRLSSIATKDPALQTLLGLADTLQKKLGTVRSQLVAERARPQAQRDEAKIANLKDLTASTQAQFFKVSQEIKAANPNFEKVMTVKPHELKKAQRAIPADAVLVEYVPLGDQLYIFVVTQTDLKIYTPAVKPAQLWEAVRSLRGLIDKAQLAVRGGAALPAPEDDPALRNALAGLYDMLITPIAADLAPRSTVAFIPTGLLYYVPMHALAHATAGGGLRYLIEDKQVAYLAAADVLAVVQTRNTADFGNGLLALGDPTGANLPAARLEVQDIARVYPAAQALVGDGATKAYLLDPKNLDHRILHLATHGVLDGADPSQSYIQLAGSGENAMLRMGEVYGMPLDRVDLVTLSACQTALGQANPDGSEITSLAEAFSSAGAPSVVASLWSVQDDSTRRLMDNFYRALSGGKSKGAALQSAQVALLGDPRTRNPFYWAAFEVLGDWR